MNEKFKNKGNKIEVMYTKSINNTNKCIQDPNPRMKDLHLQSFSTSYALNSISYNKNFRSNNYKLDNNTSVKNDRGDTSTKSFINPKVLRRQRTEETRVYGQNACQALFQSRHECIVRAWFIQSVIPRFKETLRWMAINHKAYHIVNNTELIKVSGTEHHDGVCFLIKKRNGTTVQQWISQAGINDCVLVLENIGNPHNLGAIIRSCAYFGVKGILLSNTTLLESGAAIRTAEGGAEYIQPIIIGDSIINALKEFRKAGYTIITTSKNSGVSLFKVTLPRKMVLILSQECIGLSDNVNLLPVDLSIYICGIGNIESLNISVATGILLSEWWHQINLNTTFSI